MFVSIPFGFNVISNNIETLVVCHRTKKSEFLMITSNNFTN